MPSERQTLRQRPCRFRRMQDVCVTEWGLTGCMTWHCRRRLTRIPSAEAGNCFLHPLLTLPLSPQLKVSPGLSVFDADHNLIPLADVGRDSVVKAIVRLGYVWTTNGHFGATWQLSQLLVVRVPEAADGAFAFVEE